MSRDALLRALRERVCDEIGRVTRPGPVALLDFPNYGNPGDSAIWLGALDCLSALGFEHPVYTSDQRAFDERALLRALPTGTILLTGGGNLGDLWPRHQAFRERVLRAFPNHAIVQLPQSIHFDDAAALTRARTSFAAHRDFTLLVRDTHSLEVATADLHCRARLCPDLAFCLMAASEPALRVGRHAKPTLDTLRLLRSDHEAGGESSYAVETHSVDWADDVRSPLNRIATRLGNIVAGSGGSIGEASITVLALRTALSACYPALARQRLRRGCQLLGSARVVITDRLHGHILALLLGVPHVVVGDRHGKLRGFIDTWTSSASLLRWADTPGEVVALTGELLSDSASARAT